MSISGIYLIRNSRTKKVYIGSAVNIKQRWREHYKSLQRKTHGNRHLQNAWNKYGEKTFEFKILFKCDVNELLFWEQRAINLHKILFGWNNLYNLCPIAGSSLGIKRSLKTRMKLSEVFKKRKASLITRIRISKAKKGKPNGCLGKKLSQATKDKISIGNKGKKRTLETKIKLSEANKGKILSPEHCIKLSESHKGKKLSLETREKISISNKGKHNHKGRKHSLETREKMSVAQKTRRRKENSLNKENKQNDKFKNFKKSTELFKRSRS